MAIAGGYDFDRVLLSCSIYAPQAYENQEQAELLIRESLDEIMQGKKGFLVSLMSTAENVKCGTDAEIRVNCAQLPGFMRSYR